MAKASGTIDMKAMKEVHDDASTKATNYITDITETNGIKIKSALDINQYVTIDSHGMKVYKDAINVAEFGNFTRIGKIDGSHVSITPDNLSLFTSDNKEAFSVTSAGSAETIKVTKSVPEFVYIYPNNDQGPVTYIIPSTNIVAGTLVVNLYQWIGADLVRREFKFTYGISQTKTANNITVSYTAPKTITITNNSIYAAIWGEVTYNAVEIPSVLNIPGHINIRDIKFSEQLISPKYTRTNNITAYNDRVDWDETFDDAYIQIGKWIYVNVATDIAVKLNATNFYAIMQGFPAPDGAAALSAYSPKNGGVYSAYINNSGRLCVVTGPVGLNIDDAICISGWYLTQ